MLKLSEFIKLLKKYALNPAISDESFLNAVLYPYVSAGKIKDKYQEDYHLNKSRTSEIMNQKADVPSKLRKALSMVEIEKRTIEEMYNFLEDYIDSNKQTALVEKLTYMAKSENIILDDNTSNGGVQDVLNMLLTRLLFKSLSNNNKADTDIDLLWKHGVNTIDVQSGDLFHFGFDNRHKKKNIVVIPVNTAFDTHVTRKLEGETYPIVSENTIHGQWLVRLKETGENLELIDERIRNSLNSMGFCPIKESYSRNGNNMCYPIGSVAIIETKNAFYFLTAIAEFDIHNNARSSSEDIDAAITSLLTVYDRFGLGYDLYIPLLGTGLSRTGLSTQEAYDLLIDCLTRNSSLIHGHIHLVIRSTDRNEIKRFKED
ncbi:MAG: hypothetical protein IKQ22_08100 [Clostridia bacterium]|nr:hypothetical protein [Clostridia bacterium]